jgi:hypothetical protein
MLFFFLDCINGDIPRPYNMLLLRQGAALISFDLIKCILKKILIISFYYFTSQCYHAIENKKIERTVINTHQLATRIKIDY